MYTLRALSLHAPSQNSPASMRETDPDEQGSWAGVAGEAAPAAAARLILLGGDAQGVLGAASNMLLAAGYQVAPARDAHDALCVLQTQAPELLVVDAASGRVHLKALAERLTPQLLHARVPVLWLGKPSSDGFDPRCSSVVIDTPFVASELLEAVDTTEWLVGARDRSGRHQTRMIATADTIERPQVGSPSMISDELPLPQRRPTTPYDGLRRVGHTTTTTTTPPPRSSTRREARDRADEPTTARSLAQPRRGSGSAQPALQRDTVVDFCNTDEFERPAAIAAEHVRVARRRSSQSQLVGRQHPTTPIPRRAERRTDSRGYLKAGALIADRWEVIQPLGGGGSARVYHVVDRQLNDECAVKVLRDSGGDVQQRRFRREMRICRELVHPNIVRTFEFGAWGDQLFYTMELLAGRDLAVLMCGRRKSQPLATRHAVELFGQVCEGLSFAHDNGVIHRDVKPHNLMVQAAGGQVKITDFGSAWSSERSTAALTIADHVIGTPAYLPPERLEDEPLVLPQSDIYSLGTSMYHCFTGQEPFSGRSLHSLLASILFEQPAAPRALNPAIPHDLERIIVRAMAKDPQRRCSDCREFAAELAQLAGSL